ncbi:MAG: flippase [bacterium]
MGATRSVARNTLWLTLGLLSGRALGIFLIRKMTPVLGADGMGVWGAAIDLSAILQVIANFGLGTLLTREITRNRGMTLPLFWNTLRVRWAIGAICYVLLLIYVDVSGFESLARQATLVIGAAIFIEAAAMACDAVLQAHEKVQYQSVGQIVSAVVYFWLGWVWLDAGHGLMGVIWANLASRVVRLAVMAPLMFWRTGPWRLRDPEGGRAPGVLWMVKLGWPLFLSTTFGIIYNKIDTVMLKEMIGDSAAGVYVLGHRALDMMIILPSLFGTAMFPAMARYGLGTARDAIRLGERSLRLMNATMIPFTLFLTFTAGPIIRWFDASPQFADSVPVLMIVIWGLPLQAANIVFNRLLITAERERAFVFIGLFSMLVNVILNTLFIPRYGYFGASAATIVSMLTSFLLHIRFLSVARFRPALGRSLWGPIVATAGAWLLAFGTATVLVPGWGMTWKQLPLDLGWGPFLGATGLTFLYYAGGLVALKVVGREDLVLLRELRSPRLRR